MEQDKNTQDLEKFVRRQLEGIEPKPDADTWSKIAGRQQPLNTWLRFRFYGIRVVAFLGTIILVWAIWQYNTPETPASPAPSDMLRQQNVAGNSKDSALNPFEPEGALVAESDATATRFGAGQKRPDWYRHNTVPMQQVRFSAEKGIQYQSPVSGNKVRIPGGILVYKDGSPVSGAVDLMFREYRTIADFLAAGMPMHYQDERGTFFFNSGGMFEVRVSQNGADLFIAPGKSYNVDFAPTASLENANLFFLPDESNQWGHLPHGQQALQDTMGLSAMLRPRILTEKEVVANNTSNTNLECLPGIWLVPDTADAVAWLQEAIETGRAFARGKIQPPMWFRKNPERDDKFFMRGLDRSEIRIVHRHDTEERFFPDDPSKVFSELAAFKECYFTRLVDSTDALWRPDPQNSVDQMFRQQRPWKRVVVYPLGGSKCEVVFGDEDEEIRVAARLSRGSERGSAIPFNPAQVFAEYERLRHTRLHSYTDAIQAWRHFVAMADMHQTPEEWCFPVKLWFDYFEENRKTMQQRYDSLYQTGITTNRALAAKAIDEWKERIRKLHYERIALGTKYQDAGHQMAMTLQVSGFGTYNWDQIFQLASPLRYLYPRYKTLGGETIAPVATRVIDRERRLFFSLQQNDNLFNLPGRMMDVIVTGTDGRTYYMPGKTYSGLDLKNKDQFTFVMEDVTDKVGSPLEWSRLLGI